MGKNKPTESKETKVNSHVAYDALIENINRGLSTGYFTEEQAEELKLQGLNRLQEKLLEDQGIENNKKEINTKMETFGNALLALIEEEYETQEDGIEAVMEVTGYDEETVIGLINGDFIPDVDLVNEIATAFDITSSDENALLGLHTYAAEDREEDIFDLIELNEVEDDFDEDEDVDPNEEDEDEDEDYVEEDEEETASIYSAVERLERQNAEFQQASLIRDELDEIVRECEELVEAGVMLPVEYNKLLGNVPQASDKERVATFSKTCAKNDVDIPTEIYAMRKCIAVFKRRGNIAPFGRIVEQELSDEDAEFNTSATEQAKRDVELYKNLGFL